MTGHPSGRPASAEVAVLGSGICGITMGTVLQEQYPDAAVTVYSDENPDIVSYAAGAQFYPIWLGDRLAVDPGTLEEWFLASKRRFTEHTLAGLAIRPAVNYELFTQETPAPDYFSRVLDHFDVAADTALPPGFTHRYRFDTMVINPVEYLPQIRNNFVQNGGHIVRRRFDSLRDVTALEEDVIFNCLGLGSQKLFGDGELQPVRGVSLRLPPLRDLKYAVSYDEWIIAPRGTKDAYTETYVGAPYRPGLREAVPTDGEVKEILEAARQLVEMPQAADGSRVPFAIAPGSLDQADIRQVRAGFRPVRTTGPRVERERIAGKTVVHNYGHGGNGVILSWGTAEHAAGLLQD